MRRLVNPYFREFGLPAMIFMLILILWAVISGPAKEELAGIAAGHEFPALEEIRLSISKNGLWKLRVLRERALKDGVLMELEDPWVRAYIRQDGRLIPAKVRLKGDWTDHLKGTKWSFRVEIGDSLAYGRMKSFSLQHPRTRNFLDEWLFHKALQDEGILAPRYDFVKLNLNGMQLGVYAIEEHFTKHLVEAQGRREGPLLKFYEEGMWEARVRVMQDTFFPYVHTPLFEAAHPEAFRYRSLLLDAGLKKMHTSALNLMQQYKDGSAPPASVFNLTQVAVQYALTDVFGGHHSQVWHNRRFYFNPVISRLEPVVYDAYAGMPGEYLEGPFAGYGVNGRTDLDYPGDVLQTYFFRDSNFLKDYYASLWHFSDPKWVEGFIAKYAQDAAERVSFLNREFWMYSFDAEALKEHAHRTREGLQSLNQHALRWDSTQVGEGEYVFCLENLTPLALWVNGSVLDAHDGQNSPSWMEWKAAKRPEVKVLGQDEPFQHVTAFLRADN